LASGAITSTPGVITSFSCIALLLLPPVPWTRVVASRIARRRTPHAAAGGGDTRIASHDVCPGLSANFIPPGIEAAGGTPALRRRLAPCGCAERETGQAPLRTASPTVSE